jgi:predicted transposase/invertase (TIGR01784 family)
MKPSKIQSVHDHFFRESMSRIEIAKSLLLAFVKTIILKNIDFSSFEIHKGDWIDEKLHESRSDIIYRAKLLNQDEYIYFLFEHKSTPDEFTPYQIHRYMQQIWDEHKNQNPLSRKIPVILSIIVYHGEKTWNVSNSMKPLFAIIEGTEEYVPDFRSEIIDLSGLSNVELSDNVELNALLMALKYSRSTEVFKVLPVIIRMFNSLGEKEDDYLKVVLLYIGSLVEERKIGEFLKIIRVEHIDGVLYMKTIADALAEKGRKEERKKSHQKEIALHEELRQKETALREDALRKEAALREDAKKKIIALQEETVRRMLQKNMNIQLIHEITGLTIERIEVIQKKKGL